MKVFNFVIALLVPVLTTAAAHASLYEERARPLAQAQRNSQIARVNQHYDKVQERYLLNLARFGAANSGFASTPECRDRNGDSRGGGWRTTRQVCGSQICVNVFGSQGDGRDQSDIISVDIYRKYEMIDSCEVVLRNGLACRVSYNHSPKDGWMTGFGGTCIDGNGQARQLSVPFKNVKF